MADSRLSQLTPKLSIAGPDLLLLTDSEDPTQSPQGTSKSITFTNLIGSLSVNALSGYPLTVAHGGTGTTTSTGSGSVVLSVSPTLVTPTLGVALATSLNGLSITTTTGTLNISNGKTLAVQNSLTFNGTDTTAFTFPVGSDTVAGLTSTQTLANKTITDSTNNVTARSLKSATTTVDVSAATAPTTGQVLTATSGTAATWQTPSASGSTDGWTSSADTWVFASATSFTIAGVDRTAIYTKGTRVKFTNNSITVFGIVASSAFSTNTTVTLIGNSDYSINNSAITNPFYSYQVNPQGYPNWFNFATAIAWNGTAPTGPTTVCKFSALGNTLYFYASVSYTNAGSADLQVNFSLPVAALGGANQFNYAVTGFVGTGPLGATPTQQAIAGEYDSTSAPIFQLTFSSTAARSAATQGFYLF